MSSFQCPKCQAWCLDMGGRGYVSGCEHYPVPEEPGPTLNELADFAREEYGPRVKETRLLRHCLKCYPLYRAGFLSLDADEKMLLLFIAEAWRWRRIDHLSLVKA